MVTRFSVLITLQKRRVFGTDSVLWDMKVSQENPYVYIITNQRRTVLYVGVTNDLTQRLIEHFLNDGKPNTFAGKYHCYFLLYYEEFKYINEAIAREKQIKKWSWNKKPQLIESMNPKWQSLNGELFDQWPPRNMFHRKDL